jgi:hypothetical protein
MYWECAQNYLQERNYLGDFGAHGRTILEYAGDEWIFLAEDRVRRWVLVFAVKTLLGVSKD